MNNIIKEIIDAMSLIEKREREYKIPNTITKAESDEGLRVSKQGSDVPREVPMTPLMKELLLRTKEKVDDDWRLLTTDKLTKAEEYVNQLERSYLITLTGKEMKEYDEQLPLLSEQHYWVQCWLNVKENKRDVGPDQYKQRLEGVSTFLEPTKHLGIKDLLAKDVAFQKAVEVVMDNIPKVKCNDKYELVDQPFMNKDSNVGYPFFRNDRAIDPKTGKTYGLLAVELARATKLEDLWKYNYTTLFGRNQKLKGRWIFATSRVVNVVLNRLEAEEINMYKERSPLFKGYRDDKELKSALQQMVKYCETHGLKCRNMDQSKFDQHVNSEFIKLIGAMSMVKAIGNESKLIALHRTLIALKTVLVNGPQNCLSTIYGRIFSGYIDTNRGGGLVNAVAVLYALMKQDLKYSTYTYNNQDFMYVMGDDNLYIYKTLDYDKLKKDLFSVGFEVNKEKDEFGPFFLQYRLFEYGGQQVMAYAWTRILRGMLFKERPAGLGPYGWIMSWWSQIAKAREYKPGFAFLVNFAAEYDQFKIGLTQSVSYVLQQIQKEDEEARSKLKTTNQRNRFVGTFDKLHKGDPQEVNMSEGGYLEELFKEMKEVYDPNFFNKYHLPKI